MPAKPRLKAACLILSLALLIAGSLTWAAPAAAAGPTNFCLALDIGGIAHNSFNNDQWTALKSVAAQHGLTPRMCAPEQPDQLARAVQTLLDKGCDVLFGGAWQYKDILAEAAEKNPSVRFILVDSQADAYPGNLTAVRFKQEEPSYLAGALAAGMTKNGRLGFVGAVEFPVLESFRLGFEAGAKREKPGALLVDTAYVDGENPWNDPNKARELAETMFSKKDVEAVLAAAMASDTGVVEAARASGGYVISAGGVTDFNANPALVAVVSKKAGEAVKIMVEEALAGSLENRLYQLGIDSGAVGLELSPQYRDKIPVELKNDLDILRQGIAAGEIKVPGGVE